MKQVFDPLHLQSNEENTREEISYEVESIPTMETQIEGVIETLDEAFLRPFNPPLTCTSIPVLAQVPSQFYTMSHQRYTPEMDERTLGIVGFPSTTQSVILPVTVSTINTSQCIALPENYRYLDDIVGLDQPLAYLIQFGRLDLNLPPITLPHIVPQ